MVFNISQFCDNYHDLTLALWNVGTCVGLCGLNCSQGTRGKNIRLLPFYWPPLSSFFYPSQILPLMSAAASLVVFENWTLLFQERHWRCASVVLMHTPTGALDTGSEKWHCNRNRCLSSVLASQSSLLSPSANSLLLSTSVPRVSLPGCGDRPRRRALCGDCYRQT